MAITVELLQHNLDELLLHHPDSLSESGEQVEYLKQNLQKLKRFLKNCTKKPLKEEEDELVFHQIRDLVYKMDDAIDDYVTQLAIKKQKIFPSISLHKPPTLLTIVDSNRQQIDKYCKIIDDDHHRQSLKIKAAPIREVNVMGLEDETLKVMKYLREESEEVDVISIVGKPGIGKTTLAWKIYKSAEAILPTRIWVNVSDEFTEKEVFLDILKQITSLTGTADEDDDDINGKDDKELAGVISTYLEKEKFLIVMDGVWSASDWDRLRVAVPKHSKQGKVLITSCDENVGGRDAKIRSLRVKVEPLNNDQSWSLLESEVFGDKECPPVLKLFGKLIVEQCDGLPVDILALTRILVDEDLLAHDMTERELAWTKVCSRVPEYRINFTYSTLPNHLRLCFLYFGMFPYDEEIRVWKLIRMWIAEGFIQERPNMSLEETAETYLLDLINKNLIAVEQMKSNGKVKTCRINRMQHDFCKNEAGNGKENFLQSIALTGGVSSPPIPDLTNCRRLSIFSNISGFLSSKPSGPRVRTFVDFSTHKDQLPTKHSSAIPGFKLLRVVDVKPIKLTKIPRATYILVHLRFLALSFDSSNFPAGFSNLWSLQTLVVCALCSTLEMEADIWELTQLRHVKTNASLTLAKSAKNGKQAQNLQTLSMISPECCTKELFNQAPKLNTLGIRGELSSFLKGKIGSFDCLANLTSLENLKLLNDVEIPPSEDPLHSLSPSHKFPPGLRSLTLVKTHLDWSQMSILASLEKLEVLKLKDNAFMGREWVIEDKGFLSLEALHIRFTDLVFWVASAHHFPRLIRLKLHQCEQLREVPFQLADIPSLQHLELLDATLAAASAIRIEDEIKKQASQAGRDFKLSISPAIE